MLRGLWSRTRRRGRWSAAEREVRDELLLHLQQSVADLQAAGMSPEQARVAAEQQFGDLEALVKAGVEVRMSDPHRDPLQLSRDGRRAPRLLGATPMSDLIQDLRFALRTMRKSPAFALVAIVSLALGIGFNTTMFTLIDAVLFKPRGVADTDTLMWVHSVRRDGPQMRLSYPEFEDVRDLTEVFSGVATYRNELTTYNADGNAEFLFGESATWEFFDVLGVQPLIGRDFAPEEDVRGQGTVVMISEGFWRDRFAADADVLGEEMILGGTPLTIIGVVPAAYVGGTAPIKTAFWVPMGMTEMLSPLLRGGLDSRSQRNGQVVARLAPGVTPQQANEAVAALGVALAEEYPDTNKERGLAVMAYADVRLDPTADRAMLPAAGVLMAVVGLVLLIACANVANMMLARASARRQEIGVRLAIGAGRGRLIRQMLTESALLSAIGGVAAIGLAWATLAVMLNVQPATGLPLSFDVEISPRTLLFTGVVAMLTGLVFGLVPALQATRADLASTIKADEIGRDGKVRGSRLRNALVVVQVAVSVVLLVGAMLLARSLASAYMIDPGIATEAIVGLGTGLPFQGYEPEEARAFHLQVMERIAALPGIDGVAFAERMPLDSTMQLGGLVHVEGEHLEPDERPDAAGVVGVSPNYFELLQIPITTGRGFSPTDVAEAPGVAVINPAFAERFWPGENAIGKRFAYEQEGTYYEVVGITAPHKVATLGEEPEPYGYLPMAQYAGTGFGTIVVHMTGEPAAVIESMRREVQALDAKLAIMNIKTVREFVDFGLLPVRLAAMSLGVLGAIGTLLAAIGVYGVVAFAVARRTREIGIRMAIGADRRGVVRMVVSQGMRTVGIGMVIGLLLSAGATQALKAALYGVSPIDPVAFGLGGLAMLAVALLANLLPAMRAAAVNPVTTLRSE